MKIILLGTAGYHPNDQRQTACLMLPELGIVLDAGTAFYRVHDYLCTNELDVFITHAHLDHVIGITYLFDVIRDKSVRRVTVHGMPDKLAALEQHLFAPVLFPVIPPCELRPLSPSVALPEGGRLTHFPLAHPGGAIGFRLDWPEHSMAYVTDTTASASAQYIDAIRGVNLLVHECNFDNAYAEQAARWGHSSIGEVLALARAARVKKLVLVHINPTASSVELQSLQLAASGFPATILGSDRMEIDF